MRVDYHAHTPRCGHARGAMPDYVERALALGFAEFGFCEHSPWMIQRRGQWQALRWEELDAYVADVQALQGRYDRDGAAPFRVRLGLEMDFVPTRLELARRVAEAYPWDVLLGSVHHLGLWCLPSQTDADLFGRWAFEDVCALYFELVAMMIRERFCDVIAHLDFVKRYAPHAVRGTAGSSAGGADLLRWVEPLIPEIRRAGMAVEINTSGLDHPVGEPYPGWAIIEALAAAGVPLLVQSDAHAPEQVGRHREPVIARLRALGVRELVRFERRRAIACPLA